MKIDENGLADLVAPDKFKEAACHGGLFHDPPKFIIAHWTGGSRFESAVAWLTNPLAKASAHFVIGRQAELAQLVSVNMIAWHAGKSKWECDFTSQGSTVYEGLNKFSLGVEFVNLGKLKKTEAGTFVSSMGRLVDPSEVIFVPEGATGVDGKFYQSYTPEQLERGDEVMDALKEYFPSIEDVIGHSYIAPSRKLDPGPLFPFDHYRARLLGRTDDPPSSPPDGFS
jgi:N-acetylmuramoyl-L-alanine amidase